MLFNPIYCLIVSLVLFVTQPKSNAERFPLKYSDKVSIDSLPDQENQLLFMLGTWKTSGTQFWYDQTWVEHKGLVEGKLLDDGVTIERTFWAAFGNGASLGGKALIIHNPLNKTWSGKWVPTTGNWEAGLSMGRMEDKEYIEIARGSDATGKFVSKTRIFDISEDSYRVSTDLYYDSGVVSKNNWNILFERVKEVDQQNIKPDNNSLTFMLGNWMAEGTLDLGNGTKASHKSFVDANLGKDGKTIEREFWGSISVGGALRGLSTHKPGDSKDTWNVQWAPTGGAAGPPAKGQFKGDEFIEEQQQQTPNGMATVRTRYFQITPSEYKVQTDVVQKNGEVSEAVWTVTFRKIA